MTQQTINIGVVANDGTGDDLRVAMQKINENFTEVYSGTLAATTLEFTANNIISTGTNNAIVFIPNGTGTIDFPGIRINDNNIEGLRSNDSVKIIPNGTGTIELEAGTNITGALAVSGLSTLASFKGATGSTVTAILDEDTMSSNSDTALATQQSIKAYVDAQITSTNTLRVADDGSTVISIELDNTLSVAGATGITTSVAGSTLTITGPDLSSYLTNSPISLVGDDSTGTVFNTGETVKIAGTQNVTTAVSGDTLTITGPDLSSYITNSPITVVGDDSTGTTLNTGETLKVTGTGGLTAVVSGDTLTIDGSGVAGGGGLTFVGDDSTGTVFNTGETVKIAGGTNITTAVSGDVLTIAGSTSIDVNEISSTDSSAIQINDSVNISGILSVNTIDTNTISSTDSSAIQILDNIQCNANLFANDITGTVIQFGSSGSPVSTNQTIDMSAGRHFEIFTSAAITLTLNNFTYATFKTMLVVNTSASTRLISFDGTYSTGITISHSFNAKPNSEYLVLLVAGIDSVYVSESLIGGFQEDVKTTTATGISGTYNVVLDGSNYFNLSINGVTTVNIPNNYPGVYYYKLTNTDASSHAITVQVNSVTKLTFTLSANGSTTAIGSGPLLSASYQFTGYVLITETGDSVITAQPINQ